MAATELTGEEALAEQAGTAFAEGNCAQALELLVQLQKLREAHKALPQLATRSGGEVPRESERVVR